ncbi:tyrosine/phenylalanine carboxypeptidase domain-containing protein [Polyangium jinanense]|nr:tyrosine/phenylalanine carboxypeptidase domain-containing protein [Polyangium jinanense]
MPRASGPHSSQWITDAGNALVQAASRVRMIMCTTPTNLRAELDRLGSAWARGDHEAPRFSYEPPPDHDGLVGALGELAAFLENEGPLGAVYAGRAREIAAEARVCSAVGTKELWAAARKRFGRRDHYDDAADDLARRWLSEPPPRVSEEDAPIRSDDEADEGSLLVRMRAEIGARRLPFRVVVVRDLSSLAATGESVVQVAAGRSMTRADVERTVLHEIEGHVLPRCRAAEMSLGIFVIGTQSGADDQEGRALWLERRAGALVGGRRRELASRHVAARTLEAGADFVEAARLLLSHGASVPDALRITARVYRGGGLGREIVYLPALLRVEAALAVDPALDGVLGAGRVSVDAAAVLRPFASRAGA